MSKAKKAAQAELNLSDAQRAALDEARNLQQASVRAGILSTAKPDQYPHLIPSKGESMKSCHT
jgi:hypothetical protein